MEASVSSGKAGNGQSFEVSMSYLRVKTIICRLKCICFGFPLLHYVGLVVRTTVEPRFNEVPRDWGNWFVISRFCSIHFKRPDWRISFVVPRTSLNRGSTVVLPCYFLACFSIH